ncbi:retrovirus-related pol polyprotein from transposon TNT 1-94, partial [Tanacetum coccineum]
DMQSKDDISLNLVIIDDYSRYIRTDNGTEFVNKDLTAYYERVGISHQKTIPRTPQQNGVVERRNCTLVEAARTMLIFSKALMFLWAEAVATAYHPKTPWFIPSDKEALVYGFPKKLLGRDIMADLNIPANDAPVEQAPAVAPPTRTDDQILPLSKAFTTSSTIPSIYIQQFWDTMCFNSSTWLYNCQLDEKWFYLHKDILKDALDNNPFVAPPSSDTIIEYVNTLGYPSTLKNVLAMSEEFVQSIQTFLTDRKNLATTACGKKKTAHLLISKYQVSPNWIIASSETSTNIHPRTGLPLHYSREESILNTLRLVRKDGREIFGMSIPDALLTDEIKGAPNYDDYQEHVANDKGVPVEEPAHTDEEADLQRALELKVQGKRKEKVVDEQATHNILTLQTPTKKSPIDQFIFQRYPPMPTEPTGHADSPSLDTELALTVSETKSDKEVHVFNTGDQDEGQAGPNLGEQEQCQDIRNNLATASYGKKKTTHLLIPNVRFTKLIIHHLRTKHNIHPRTGSPLHYPYEEESGKTNAKSEVQSMVLVPIHQDTSSVPPMTTLVINLTTMQSDSPLPTSTATTSIITTTTSLPPPPQPQQSIADPILVSHIGELEQHMVDLIQNNLALEERLDKHGTRLHNLEILIFPTRDLPTVDMKEILQQRMFEDNSYKAHEVHNYLYEALQKSLELDYSNQRLADQEEARKKKRKKHAAPRTLSGSLPSLPPPPPPPKGISGTIGILGASGSSQRPPPPPPPSTGTAQQQGSKAPSLSKTAASASQSMAWTTSDTRFESTDFSVAQALSPTGTNIKKRTKIKTKPDKTEHENRKSGRK